MGQDERTSMLETFKWDVREHDKNDRVSDLCHSSAIARALPNTRECRAKRDSSERGGAVRR